MRTITLLPFELQQSHTLLVVFQIDWDGRRRHLALRGEASFQESSPLILSAILTALHTPTSPAELFGGVSIAQAEAYLIRHRRQPCMIRFLRSSCHTE